jgi:hypothetical protein
VDLSKNFFRDIYTADMTGGKVIKANKPKETGSHEKPDDQAGLTNTNGT